MRLVRESCILANRMLALLLACDCAGLVVAIGMKTRVGNIAHLLHSADADAVWTTLPCGNNSSSAMLALNRFAVGRSRVQAKPSPARRMTKRLLGRSPDELPPATGAQRPLHA